MGIFSEPGQGSKLDGFLQSGALFMVCQKKITILLSLLGIENKYVFSKFVIQTTNEFKIFNLKNSF